MIADIENTPAPAIIFVFVLFENSLYAARQTKRYGTNVAMTEISANLSKRAENITSNMLDIDEIIIKAANGVPAGFSSLI